MFKRILMIICISLLTAGCATTRQFAYDHPAEVPESGRGKIVAAITPVQDKREGGKEIDRIYEKDPLKEIDSIVREELMSTGLFREISLLSEGEVKADADLVLEPSLTKMEWEVPGYKALLGKTFMVSFLTGGVGGLIYGSTSTDVHGDTSLHMRMTERSGNVLIDKTYDGHCELKMAKLKCDIPETKAAVVGKALKSALEALKSDVVEKFSEPKPGMISSSEAQIIE